MKDTKQKTAARLLNEQIETCVGALNCAEDEAYSARTSYEELSTEIGELKRMLLKMVDYGKSMFMEIDGETYFCLRLEEKVER